MQQVVRFFSTGLFQVAVIQLDYLRILVTYPNLAVFVILVQPSRTLCTDFIVRTVGLSTTTNTATTTSHNLNKVVRRLFSRCKGFTNFLNNLVYIA